MSKLTFTGRISGDIFYKLGCVTDKKYKFTISVEVCNDSTNKS